MGVLLVGERDAMDWRALSAPRLPPENPRPGVTTSDKL